MDTQAIVHALPEIFTQLLAFLAVFWILKRFGFKPILKMIDDRRSAIEHSFSDIERQKQKLESLEKEYRAKIEHIEQEARLKIQEAAGQGSALARDIQDKARQDAQKLVERAKAEIEHDLAQAKLAMRQEIIEVSSLMTEKVLKEKIDGAAHKRLVDDFLKELERV